MSSEAPQPSNQEDEVKPKIVKQIEEFQERIRSKLDELGEAIEETKEILQRLREGRQQGDDRE